MNDPLLSSIVRGAIQMGASDIHLRSGQAPFLRVSGLMGVLEAPPLSSGQLRHCLDVCATSAGLQGAPPSEFSVDLPGLARLRVSAFLSDGDWSLSFRLVPLSIPSFTDLRLPPVMKNLATPRPGLVLVTGPTGAGKSTTSASLLQAMLQMHRLHIVTIEDPIEYRFVSPTSCITQRELGRDASSPAEALRQAMRMDPDVIFVGEVRDDATFELALHAAETGVCVFATMHTQSAVHTISRITAMTKIDLQAALRERIAEALRAIVSQRLLPRRGTTTSRVVCTEVLINSYSLKEAIRDPARHKAIPGLIERGQDQGMHTFDQALLTLVGSGVVDVEVAAAFASSPTNLRRSLQLGGVVTNQDVR